MSAFVHLSLHSEYSLMDSTIRIKPLVAQALELGMPALAIADQSNLFALVKFFRAAEAAGIKPIAGADVSIIDPHNPRQADRLQLLCQNERGYRSLSELLARAYLERDGRAQPVLQRAWLEQNNAGLIALAGQHQGQFGRLLLAGKINAARAALRDWLTIFGDRFYVDIARTGRNQEPTYLEAATAIATEHDCPVVAVNDVRFIRPEDFDAHEARVCIHQGRLLGDPQRSREYTDQQYLKSSAEMATLFADLPETLENSVELAKRCNLELRLDQHFLPAYPVAHNETEKSHLQSAAECGLQHRLTTMGCAPGYQDNHYSERLTHELDVINQMGFPGYFLIVADFVRWAKKQDIPVGPGRGSGAGSLVAWSLEITDLDPLRYDLLFERFLNPERVSLPDFDIDFCMDRRDEVIDYVAQRYGRDRVCQIITFGSMAARAVVRDTGRVLGHPYGLVDGIAKLIPPTLGITLKAALDDEKELRDRVANEEDVGELMELAMALEGLARNAGKHAGGVVIAPSALTDFTSLYSEPNGESVVTQFDKDDVEAVGLVKFDFLGLRTLTIIDWALKAINLRRQKSGEAALQSTTLPLDDAATFALLKACNTTAVFQLESRGMKDLIRRLQPERFDEIVALVALFRPGPLDSGMVDTYVDCKHGRRAVLYPHPKLETILKPTYGVILYQEQVMQIAQVLAGYTLGGADILRRAMGKKKPAEMAKQRSIFVSGATARDIEANLAESIFDLMEKFAGYGFNKSHSAAYALLSYQTAYLKTHYPAEFMAAVMSADMDNTDKVVHLIDDLQALKLNLLPPNVNTSFYRFTAPQDDTILYGLGAIKGVGRNVVEALVRQREEQGPFKDLLDLCRRIDLQKTNRRVMEALVLSGATDDLGVNRASMMHALPEILKAAEQGSRNLAAGQVDLFGAPAPAPTDSESLSVTEWSDEKRLLGERDTLGLYLTGHPITPQLPWLEQIVSSRLNKLGELYRPVATPNKPRRRPPGQTVLLAGLVMNVRRRGNTMAFMLLDDHSGRIEVTIYGKVLETHQTLLQKDRLLVVEGGLIADEFSGGFQLRAQRIFSLQQAQTEFASALHLHLHGDTPDLHALRQVLQRYQGATPVLVQYHSDKVEAKLRLGPEWQVTAKPELLSALACIPQVSNAQILYQRHKRS